MFKRAPLLRVAASLAATAIGFGVGWCAASSRPAPVNATASSGRTVVARAEGITRVDAATETGAAAAAGPQSADTLRAALQAIGDRPTSAARWDEYLRLLAEWAALDPAAALAHARAELTLADRRGQAVTMILTEWAKRDPAAAWRWTRDHVADDMQPVDAVLTQAGRADSAKAWQFASELAALHPESARAGYESVLRGMMHAGGYEQAATLMRQANVPPDADGRDGRYLLADTIASEWGRHRPEQASAWVLSLPAESIGRERALINVGTSWAETEPAKAARFAAGLAPGPERERVLAATVPNWVEQAPLDAVEWLAGFAGEPEFDFVMARTATASAIQAHPAAALSLAAAISAPEYRLQTLTDIAKSWLARDRPTAEAHLQTTRDLSAETLKEIQRRISLSP
jgi:hypothetical protein